jgi:hypothetical protein
MRFYQSLKTLCAQHVHSSGCTQHKHGELFALCSSHSYREDLPPVMVDQGVTLARVESRLAIWKGARHISSHVDGYRGIRFAVPEVDLRVNVLEAETPGSSERYDFPVHALRTVTIGFDEIFLVNGLDIRSCKRLLVCFGS